MSVTDEEFKQLERHLGLLTSRFDALEGRTEALEIQHGEIIKVTSGLTKALAKTSKNLEGHVSQSKQAFEHTAKNLSKIIEIVDNITKTINGMQETANSQMTLTAVTAIVANTKNSQEQDLAISRIPDEKMKREVRAHFDRARRRAKIGEN